MPRARLILFLSLALSTAANAPGQSIAGYAKTLAVAGKSAVTGDSWWLDLTRVRVRGDAERGEWRAQVWADLEAGTGSFYESPEASLLSGTDTHWLDLDREIAARPRFRANARIFRATLTRYGRRATFSAGRQRVAWGTGFVWTPTDLLHPVSPVSLERDEKDAVDALSLSIHTGARSGVDVVLAAARGFPDRSGSASGALRYRTHLGEFDLTAMAGRFHGDWTVGGDFAGYVRNAGLRGEAALRDRGGDRTVRALMNLDYTLSGGTYTFVEVHYNGPGASSKEAYDFGSLLAGEVAGLGRWYAAASASHPLTPLVGIGFYGIASMTDGSGLLGPVLTWSLAENLDGSASMYGFVGAGDSEFGSQSAAYFVTLQYYF